MRCSAFFVAHTQEELPPMLATALAGIVMAITMSAPPGPVAMETVRRGLQGGRGGGFWPALHVQLGSVIGDMLWCGLALAGLAPLVQIDWVRGLLSVAGVIVLVYLGVTGIRDGLKSKGPSADLSRPADGQRGAFRSGMAISMANPMAIGFWISLGGTLVAAGVAGTTATQTAAFLGGYLGGTLVWCLVMALAVRWSQVVLKPVVFRWVTLACSAALLVFGAGLAWRMFEPLLV